MSCTDGSYCVVSKEEDRGEGVVRLVDVYESIEAIRENHAAASTWHKEWKRFRCSCYYISIDKKSWNESREDCRSRGAHLVIINSKEEQEFVSKINGHGSSWIGLQLQKIHSENWSGKDKWQWKWVDGSLPNYLAWLTAVTLYPENTPNAYIGGRGKWEYDEDGPKQWICETDI
uniref:Natural killer cells antigen CD94-like n=1 Tax=Echeneis naucrates TaxID=173247 RepID=A0A665U5N1_ECHNA